jgi:SAM-dependent methyltransferase
MQSKNIHYSSKQLVSYYQCNRQRWDEFYPSEKWVFERLFTETGKCGDILDVGCACGGLGKAFCDRFILDSYTGVDINQDAIDWAENNVDISVPVSFYCGDIVDLDLGKLFDVVLSLSCADWNIETGRIINTCWSKVRPGGYFIISLRITPEKSINDISKSYQKINFSGEDKKPEIANYVVLNFKDSLELFKTLTPKVDLIGAYGYWGKPSDTAVTVYDSLVFSVFYIRKAKDTNCKSTDCEFFLPVELFL